MKRLQIYPTLRCTLNCGYCSNKIPSETVTFPEIMPERWVEIFRNLGPESIFITGGEPFLYPGLAELLNDFPEADMTIYSNLTLDVGRVLQKVRDTKKIRMRCSYHPDGNYLDQFLSNLDLLEALEIPYSVHMVDRKDAPEWRSRVFRKHGVELGIDYDQRGHKHLNEKLVRCRLPYFLMGPDRRAYHCVSRMRRGKADSRESVEEILCKDSHLCAPCDLAATWQVPEKEVEKLPGR